MTMERTDRRAHRTVHGRFVCCAAAFLLAVVLVNTIPAATKSDEQSGTNGPPPIGFYQRYISDLRYGRCQFDPSCSRYTSEAIESHGWFIGTALAADRLVRCNGQAKHHYQRGDTGRLVDEVDGRSAGSAPPRVPDWLIPQPVRPPLPPPGGNLPPHVTQSRLIEYADFADALADEGDYEKAITEYKRVAFLAHSPAVDTWSRLRIGLCYYDDRRWSESAATFSLAADHASTLAERNAAYFLTAASYFNAERYEDSAGALNRCISEIPVDGESAAAPASEPDCRETARLRFLGGLTSFASGEWTASAGRFNELAVSCPEWEYRNRAFYLAARSEDGPHLPRKHPNLAAVMSAVIPGSGQLYAGRAFDGFRHLVFDGLLIYSVYQLFKNDYYAGGYLLAGFTLPFYVGNIVGAKRACEQRNATTRRRFVTERITEAGRE